MLSDKRPCRACVWTRIWRPLVDECALPAHHPRQIRVGLPTAGGQKAAEHGIHNSIRLFACGMGAGDRC